MALFKVCRGAEGNLPSTKTDGYAYFCTDTGSFYIDHKNASNTLVRSKISANYADKLKYVKDGATIEINPADILTANNYASTIGVATTSKNGLMSSADKSKLDGIASGANNYTHPSHTAKSSGLYKVTVDSQGHVSAATAVVKADITGLGIPAQDTTYNAATTSANGLMSSTDKSKLDGIASGANKTVVDSALSDSSTNPVQNKVINSALAGKSDTTHTHNYAGSTSAGGSATSAVKLDTSAGSATNPVYFSDGKPVKTTYTLGKSVPSDAVFTDTTYDAATTTQAGLMSTADKIKLDGIATGANNYTLPTASASTLGGVKVGTNLSISNGVLSAQDTTYSVATTSANGLMSSTDKSKLDGIATGATKVIVDSALSSSSTNPVQNKVINTALAGKSDTDHTHDYIPTSQKGAASGVASLDSSGKVPTSQLPSYVDDVIEAASKSAFPATGEAGKIYVDIATNKTYRWGGSAYVEISASLAIGTTSSTAAAGNHGHSAATTSAAGFMSAADKSKLDGIASGANAYTHPTHTAKSSGLYKITVDSQGHVSGTTAVVKTDITGLGIPAQDTTYSLATTSAAGLMSSADKSKLDNIPSGIMPIDKGGTGADTAEEALANLGIYIGTTEPTDPNIKIWINTSEEGTGVTPILPRIATVTLPASGWTGNANPYSQVVAVNGVTANSKIDLQPTAQQIVSLQNDDIALIAENNAGTVTFYALGGKPTSSYTMQVLLTEVAFV